MQTIKVQFRKESDGNILAIFPYDIADFKGNVTYYAHIGQHSSCDPFYKTKLATKEEYQSLLDELIQIYKDTKLIVIKRRSHDEYLKAYYNARKSA
jgi:hypothetical protein